MTLKDWHTERRLQACRAHILKGLFLGIILAVTSLTLAQTGRPAVSELQSETSSENLRAFAKFYGYVRYFHPSDAASRIDWERFAIYGAEQVKDAASQKELEETLGALFEPIAPTVQLYAEGAAPPVPSALLTPERTSELALVAWQHRGVGLGNPGPYRSRRLHRTSDVPEVSRFGSVIKEIDIAPYRGMEMKLQAAVKTEVQGSGNQAQLWLRVDLPEEQTGFFDNMQDRPIISSTWETYTIEGTVAEDAELVAFGGFLSGEGEVWLDDVRLFVRAQTEDAWTRVQLENAGFEAESSETTTGWRENSAMYSFETVEGGVEGQHSLLITSVDVEREQEAGPLFDTRPQPGTVIEKSLGRGLRAQIPLALYSRDGQTLRPGDAPPLERLEADMQAIELSSLSSMNEALRYADITIAWNIFQHFYPYFDVIEVDWDTVLTEALRRAEADKTPEEFLYTLRWLVAQLDDGHGRVWGPEEREQAGLPFLVSDVEGEVVVVAVADAAEDICVERGDVIISSDGVPSKQVLQKAKAYISGSPQWKTLRALEAFGRAERGTKARLILERSGDTLVCTLTRDFEGVIQEARPEPIEEIRDGIFYVDLDRAEISAISAKASTLAEARGVVFDLRGYPNGNHDILRYLSDETLRSAHWQVPQHIYPDQTDLAGYDTSGRWTLTPSSINFAGQIVFLTDARAISYAESVMGIVEHYELGEIVGRTTAGANGNVNPFALPGGYRVSWTGMRVVKHDDSQHHLVGIQPTVPVERTIEGVRNGRDEDLERALELIEAASSGQ